MTENEFWYWLQGHFELGSIPASGPMHAQTNVTMGPSRAESALRHIGLVVAPSADLNGLQAVLQMACKAQSNEETRRYTQEVRERVSARFEHVIDPTTGGPEKQAKLNTLHGGRPGKRC